MARGQGEGGCVRAAASAAAPRGAVAHPHVVTDTGFEVFVNAQHRVVSLRVAPVVDGFHSLAMLAGLGADPDGDGRLTPDGQARPSGFGIRRLRPTRAGVAGTCPMGPGTAVVTVAMARLSVRARERTLRALVPGRPARALPVLELTAGWRLRGCRCGWCWGRRVACLQHGSASVESGARRSRLGLTGGRDGCVARRSRATNPPGSGPDSISGQFSRRISGSGSIDHPLAARLSLCKETDR